MLLLDIIIFINDLGQAPETAILTWGCFSLQFLIDAVPIGSLDLLCFSMVILPNHRVTQFNIKMDPQEKKCLIYNQVSLNPSLPNTKNITRYLSKTKYSR